MGIRSISNIQLKRGASPKRLTDSPSGFAALLLPDLRRKLREDFLDSDGWLRREWGERGELSPDTFGETLKSICVDAGFNGELRRDMRNLHEYMFTELEDGDFIYALRQVSIEDTTGEEHYSRLEFDVKDSRRHGASSRTGSYISLGIWREDGRGLWFGEGPAKLVLERGHDYMEISAGQMEQFHRLERWLLGRLEAGLAEV